MTIRVGARKQKPQTWKIWDFLKIAEGGGFEPPVQFNPYDSLANCWFQPLTQPSNPASSLA
jgi:hypothetical protein